MAEYQTKQRTIRGRLGTVAGFFAGTFHVPLRRSFIDFLNRPEPFFKLTDVTLPDCRSQPFFAVRRDAVEMIVPLVDEEELLLNRPSAAAYTRHSIGCIFPSRGIDGTLGVLDNVRISDHLLHHDGFCVMRDCSSAGPSGSEEALVLINTDLVIGISEPALTTIQGRPELASATPG